MTWINTIQAAQCLYVLLILPNTVHLQQDINPDKQITVTAGWGLFHAHFRIQVMVIIEAPTVTEM